MRRYPVLGTGSALVLATLACPVRAQETGFGRRALHVVTLENLAGVTYEKTYASGAFAASDGVLTMGLLSPSEGHTVANPARLGFYRFMGGGASLGMAVALASRSHGVTNYALAPRIGWAGVISPDTAVWLRGGATFTGWNQSTGNVSSSQWVLAGGGEVLFVLTPAPHVGVLIGVIGEYGFVGREKNQAGIGRDGRPSESSQSINALLFGGTVGVLVDF